MPSVIVPAHNEESVVARCLTHLSPLVEKEGYEVILVANGCTDGTATVARKFSGVTVVETEIASKQQALRMGDALATTWPRIYLDADIVAPASSIARLAEELCESTALAGRLPATLIAEGAPWVLRAYYRVRERLPSFQVALWGAGCYALSQAGHKRVSPFPDSLGDDLWIHMQISMPERVLLVGCAPVEVRVPSTIRAFLAVTRRVRRGNRELGAATALRTLRESFISAGTVAEFCDSLAFVGLTCLGRFYSAVGSVRSHTGWERDESSRR